MTVSPWQISITVFVYIKDTWPDGCVLFLSAVPHPTRRIVRPFTWTPPLLRGQVSPTRIMRPHDQQTTLLIMDNFQHRFRTCISRHLHKLVDPRTMYRSAGGEPRAQGMPRIRTWFQANSRCLSFHYSGNVVRVDWLSWGQTIAPRRLKQEPEPQCWIETWTDRTRSIGQR